MDNFIAHLNALESQSTTDKACLEELRGSNAMKQEVITNMKKELAKYNEFDQKRNHKSESAEYQRKLLMEKVATNLSRAKTLSTELETLDLECANQAANKDGVRGKLNGLRSQMSRIKELEKNLRSDAHNLKQTPEALASNIITEMRAKKAIIWKALSDRNAMFDLTAHVAEVQAIENLRRKRFEISEDLKTKSEILSNLDVDNEIMETQLCKLQTQFVLLEEEKGKVIKQKEDNDRRLNSLASQKAQLTETLDATVCEREKTRCLITNQNKKQTEIDSKLSSATLTLEGKKAEFLSKEKDFEMLKEQHETKKAELTTEQENMKSGYQQQLKILSKQMESCCRFAEVSRAEIEKLASNEHFLIMYEELCRSVAKTQEKLSNLKESRESLLKKVEEKREKTYQQKSKLESLHQEVDTKKREVEKDLEDRKTKIEKMDADTMEEETKAGDLQNKDFEIEGELHLVKHQLSIKKNELRAAKISFQEKFSETKGDGSKGSTKEKMRSKQNFNEVQKHRRRRQESTKKDGNPCKKQVNRSEEEKSDRRMTRKQKGKTREQLKEDRLDGEGRRVESLKTPKCGLQQHLSEEVVEISSHPVVSINDAKNQRWNVVKEHSTGLQHTITLASVLADDFKRDNAIDMDDSVVKEDDGGDLFGSFENSVYNGSSRLKGNVANKTVERDAGERLFEDDDNTIHFEPSELFTSTPRVVKKQSHSNGSQRPLLQMPPFRSKSGKRATEATCTRPRGRGRRKL